MGVVRRSEGILTRFFVVGLLVQTFQNTFADGKGTRGPRELLISRNRPQSIQPSEMRSSEYFKTGVPDYLLRLRERHSKEWMNFGQAEGGHGPNLGIITSIRHHWNVGEHSAYLAISLKSYSASLAEMCYFIVKKSPPSSIF